MLRRTPTFFLRAGLLSAYACAIACVSPEEASVNVPDAEFVLNTYAYKQIGETSIHADVYRHDDDVVRPVLVWIHGGALLFGSRANPPTRHIDLCRIAGCVLVSIDYRLAPDEQLPAISEDLEDALDWVMTEGPALFAGDPERMVVSGGSAGGYLTLVSGFRVRPRPTALVSYWGYGALDTFDAEPSEHYRTIAPLVTEEEAWAPNGRLYLYLRQQGLWTKVVTGFDPETQGEQLAAYAPIDNVTADYPPTLLIHGTADTDVPHEESVAMAEELARHGVEHELMLVPDGSHGLSQGDAVAIAAAHHRAATFILAHLASDADVDDIEGLMSAHATLDEGLRLARNEDIDGAVTAFERARQIEPRVTITAGLWGSLCWRGSVLERPDAVLDACNRSVELAPDNRFNRISRGRVRAMLGDFEGAAEDIEATIAEVQDSARRAERQEWLEALRAGRNPFTSTTE